MPTRTSQHRRLVRTIVLATIGAFAAIAWLARELGMDMDALLGYAGTGVLLVFSMVALALLGAAILRGLKYLLRRR